MRKSSLVGLGALLLGSYLVGHGVVNLENARRDWNDQAKTLRAYVLEARNIIREEAKTDSLLTEAITITYPRSMQYASIEVRLVHEDSVYRANEPIINEYFSQIERSRTRLDSLSRLGQGEAAKNQGIKETHDKGITRALIGIPSLAVGGTILIRNRRKKK